MSVTPEHGRGHRRPPLRNLLGWVAFVFFLAAVTMALLKIDPVGFACVAIGAVLLIVALVLEYRQRQAVTRSDQQVFPENGTFGARRSPQTHTKF